MDQEKNNQAFQIDSKRQTSSVNVSRKSYFEHRERLKKKKWKILEKMKTQHRELWKV